MIWQSVFYTLSCHCHERKIYSKFQKKNIMKEKSNSFSLFQIKVSSFNLQELLVVLVIIGILILLALPNLMPLIAKAKSLEAQTQLKHLFNLEKQYFFMHSKYSPEFNTLDFEAPKNVLENGNANYSYEVIESTNATFIARATAVTDFDGDGIYNVWEINQNQELIEVVKD